MLYPASFIGLGVPLDRLSIVVDPSEPPKPDAGMLERWSAATEANPRLFNGPLLRFTSFDKRHTTLHAARDSYLRYAMQQHDAKTASPERDVYHLAVTGMVQTRDEHGRDCVVIGKRGDSTFVYPGLWELAPGGGLESADVDDQLMREMEEELGIPGLADGSRREEFLQRLGMGALVGLSVDPNTPSVDVVVHCYLREGVSLDRFDRDWEYTETALAPIGELRSFVDEIGEDAFIPPTLAIWRGMGWL